MANEAGFYMHMAAEFGTVIAATALENFQVTLGGWSGPLDPDGNTYAFLHTGSALNIAHQSNAEANRALETGRNTSDMAARGATYDSLWEQKGSDLALIYLWTVRNSLGVS